MPQVHISEWFPSPRSSTFDGSIHAIPSHRPELDFDPDFDARMKSPSPADATMMPPPLPTTPKPTKKLACIGGGGGPRRPTRLFLSPRRVSPTKVLLSDAAGRRARIYHGSSPGRSISGSSLRVAGNAIAGSPERLALLSSASPSRSRIPSPYLSPKGKASGMASKKLRSSPSTKVSLGLFGTVLGTLKRFKAGGGAKLKLSQTRMVDGRKYVRAGNIREGCDAKMAVDVPRTPLTHDQRAVVAPLLSGTYIPSPSVRPPLAITSAEDALSTELDEMLFAGVEPMSPSTAMGFLSLGGSSSTPDVTTSTLNSESNPFMTPKAYQEAMGSRSVDTLPLSPSFGVEPQAWAESTPTLSASGPFSFNAAEMTDKDFEMTPPSSPVSISSSARRAHSRGKAVRVLGIEARGAAGMSGRKGAACANYKEAMYKEFERRSEKGTESTGSMDRRANGAAGERKPAKRSRGMISSN